MRPPWPNSRTSPSTHCGRCEHNACVPVILPERLQERVGSFPQAVAAWPDYWTMDLGHLKAELDRLAGAIEDAGGRVTERDLNYVEDSAELFYERDGERYEIHLKRLPDPLPG